MCTESCLMVSCYFSKWGRGDAVAVELTAVVCIRSPTVCSGLFSWFTLPAAWKEL